ncbi:LOW QUALITY PROTEIN: hypothetical protein TorRG33x02_176870 [Trema orientale]|uniref:Uncharacterized protein n=1 Tax=Trema orientale TaxID=63057 RepID=A0A2P5ELQ4_TREOI|nr:LOW QUALITY PROTEIN: hypothetical protein TorRG33x02_176870 [Trema orientale]
MLEVLFIIFEVDSFGGQNGKVTGLEAGIHVELLLLGFIGYKSVLDLVTTSFHCLLNLGHVVLFDLESETESFGCSVMRTLTRNLNTDFFICSVVVFCDVGISEYLSQISVPYIFIIKEQVVFAVKPPSCLCSKAHQTLKFAAQVVSSTYLFGEARLGWVNNN